MRKLQSLLVLFCVIIGISLSSCTSKVANNATVLTPTEITDTSSANTAPPASPKVVITDQVIGPPAPPVSPPPVDLTNDLRLFKIGSDGYSFIIKKKEDLSPRVQVKVYPDRGSLRLAAATYNLNPFTTLAFATNTGVNETEPCTIHIVDPSWYYEPEVVGHEFLHCVYGQWHVSNR